MNKLIAEVLIEWNDKKEFENKPKIDKILEKVLCFNSYRELSYETEDVGMMKKDKKHSLRVELNVDDNKTLTEVVRRLKGKRFRKTNVRLLAVSKD